MFMPLMGWQSCMKMAVARSGIQTGLGKNEASSASHRNHHNSNIINIRNYGKTSKQVTEG